MKSTIRCLRTFRSQPFKGGAESNTKAAQYRRALANHPFLLFGLPFLATMVAGSFFLTPVTAVRYEKHDRKVRRMTREEALGIGKSGRKVDMKEEYYRLAAKDLDDWQQIRVKRLPGEPDGKL
ncbi:BgTH12-02288 [Blumeria graminis f. sp. triticale]|uniref:Cytochrome c oxidase assembly protein COX16, mitochondrial n=3 Tax=Blumeria graminis TaxID=34373 RepID=A0A061HKW4_BLUGR|nr:Mitochondrial inner membrane protein [Blumeria graminis f. sp. tritici 96224]CAD6502045.1 BgTH12-02288 [Blumeria graminis f. sp. triticale]VDB86007.1 Bgt-2484 [Blumeria graminis f. sp. tritici]